MLGGAPYCAHTWAPPSSKATWSADANPPIHPFYCRRLRMPDENPNPSPRSTVSTTTSPHTTYTRGATLHLHSSAQPSELFLVLGSLPPPHACSHMAAPTPPLAPAHAEALIVVTVRRRWSQHHMTCRSTLSSTARRANSLSGVAGLALSHARLSRLPPQP